MLIVASWLWGTKWGVDYSQKLFAGLRRNIKQDYRTVLISDRHPADSGADMVCQIPAEDYPLLDRLGCLARMRIFSKEMQEQMGAVKGDRIVNIDVDAVITGNIDPLFNGDDEFRILQHINSTNPNPYNGSLWQFRAGERHDVWDEFSLEAAFKVKYHAIPDDQGWLWSRFPNAAAYTREDGVYGFKKRGWETGKELPANARVVVFPGRSPEKYKELDWVERHWRQ